MLDVEIVEGEEPVSDPIRFSCFTTKSRVVTWKWNLLWAVCEVNDCRPWSTSERTREHGLQRTFYAVGRPGDAQQVVELFTFIVAQIEYLASNHKRTDRAYLNSFRHGASTEVGNRLKADRSARRLALVEDAKVKDASRDGQGDLFAHAGKRTALVRAETALTRLEDRPKVVEDHMDYLGMSYGSPTQGTISGSGFGAGRSAGRTVRTSNTSKAIGGSN